MEATSMNDELYQFLACDYYATGEGRTVCLLITRAYPRSEDYEGTYPNIAYKNTAKFRAAREFIEQFGGWYARGAENIPREEFLERFGHHLPEYAKNILDKEGDERSGNFNFKQEVHFNYA